MGYKWSCSGGEGGGNGIAPETPKPRSLKARTLHGSIPGRCLHGWEGNCPRGGSGRTFLGGLEDGPLPGTCCTGRRCLRRASRPSGRGDPGFPVAWGITQGSLMVPETHQTVFSSCFVIKAVLYESETSSPLLNEPSVACLDPSAPTDEVSGALGVMAAWCPPGLPPGPPGLGASRSCSSIARHGDHPLCDG